MSEVKQVNRGTRAARPEQKLVTLQQGELEYGPPYSSLRDLVIKGVLPSVRLGASRRIWVRRSDIERLIDESTEAAS